MTNQVCGWRTRAVMALVAITMIFAVNASVDAQTSGDPIVEATIDVNQGPPGTVVQVKGRCLEQGFGSERANVRIYHLVPPGLGTYNEHKTVTPATDGSWSTALMVPLDMPSGPARVTVMCSSGDTSISNVPEFDFLVTDPNEALPVTPVARPRSGTPRFTG